MSGPVRLLVVAVTTAATVAGPAVAASADNYGNFHTEGRTAYGVVTDLTLRRPGLASGRFYDNKVWALGASVNPWTVYAGYRSRPGGDLRYITQTIDYFTGGVTTVERASTTQASLTTARVSFRGAYSDYVVYSFPSGVYSDSGYEIGTYRDANARSYTTDDNMSLSRTLTSNLGYYHDRTGTVYAWGEPSWTVHQLPACAREETPVSYYAAHRSSC